MIAYRFQKKNGEWQWLQTSSRLVYKNSKPDFVICTHRQLMEEEGRDLLGKRTMDFKVSLKAPINFCTFITFKCFLLLILNKQVSYLDTGFSSNYFTDSDQLVISNNGSASPALVNSNTTISTTQRSNRRYKTQLRDFLSTCRSKRKISQAANSQPSTTSGTQPASSPAAPIDYIADPVAVAYSNLNPIYSTSPPVPYPGSSTENLYMSHSGSFYPSAENLFHQYRIQSGYYHHPSEYHHHHPSSYHVPNGFLAYESYGLATPTCSLNTKEEKWNEEKFYNNDQLTNGRNIYGASVQQPVRFFFIFYFFKEFSILLKILRRFFFN